MCDQEVTKEDAELVESLKGKTIVDVRWFHTCGGHDWTGHEVARLLLDDGRIVEFGGTGYDCWAATIGLVNEL
mgnify:CR=1 FL=1